MVPAPPEVSEKAPPVQWGECALLGRGGQGDWERGDLWYWGGMHGRLVSLLRSFRQLGPRGPIRFSLDRRTPEYRRAFTEDRPLVSIVIPTYNRSELLTTRCLPSVLAQTYPNVEIIVIGDGCTDDTAERVAALNDPRIVFRNLPERKRFAGREAQYLVGGSAAVDHAYSIAKGQFITRLDDDDEYAPGRIEKLVAFAQQTRADLIFHPFHHQQFDGSWVVNSSSRLRYGRVTSGSILFHNWFKRVTIDRAMAIRNQEPGDWHRIRQMLYLGARIRRFPEPLLIHYMERTQHQREEFSPWVPHFDFWGEPTYMNALANGPPHPTRR